MKKTLILPLLLAVATVVLTVVSVVYLPSTVVTQFGTGGSVNTMPKLFAVALPALLGLGGAVGAIVSPPSRTKAAVVSAVGLLVFAIMLAVNL
ncbi:MAG: hypothetical protein VB039_09185 [Oscillospiraceae bacterium]|nr:hypothetical protein [Oscillospiraceae bacterium]